MAKTFPTTPLTDVDPPPASGCFTNVQPVVQVSVGPFVQVIALRDLRRSLPFRLPRTTLTFARRGCHRRPRLFVVRRRSRRPAPSMLRPW